MTNTRLSGLKLKQAIDAIGIPRAELARRCGISRQWLTTLCEQGTSQINPTLLAKLMANLRCREKDLTVEVRT